jgi:hypothetical protein
VILRPLNKKLPFLTVAILAYPFLYLSAQQNIPGDQATPPPNAATSASQQSQRLPGLFNATADFESSLATRGTETGVGKHESEGHPKPNRRGEFAFAPIPLINPSIGNGIGAAVLYVRPLGSSDTPPSTFGVGGFGTGTGSWTLGLGTKLYLRNDLFRITIGGGGGTLNYNFFGIGNNAGNQGLAIPLSQRSRAFLIEPTVRIVRKWYAGPRYHGSVRRCSDGADPGLMSVLSGRRVEGVLYLSFDEPNRVAWFIGQLHDCIGHEMTLPDGVT